MASIHIRLSKPIMQFNLEFLQISIDLYVKITFLFADVHLSLEVSDQTGETLEVNANFTNLLSREAISMLCMWSGICLFAKLQE